MNIKSLYAASIGVVFLTAGSNAATWSESINGELSENGLSPTQLNFDLGINHVSGSMGRDLPSIPVDRDIFTVTIPEGQYISKIDVITFTPPNQSFYAISSGTTVDVNSAANHLSNTLVKNTGDILPQLAAGAFSDGLGLSNPIGPGTYTIWFQELSSVVTYDIAYTVTVPEPGLCTLVGISLLGLLKRVRRKIIKMDIVYPVNDIAERLAPSSRCDRAPFRDHR